MRIPIRGDGDPSLEWMVWMYQTRQIRYRERTVPTFRQRCEDAAVAACSTLWGATLWFALENMSRDGTALSRLSFRAKEGA